jgi:hypothetical protein
MDPAMTNRFTDGNGRVDYNGLVRCYGHGVPNTRRLLSSLDNSLTLIAEGSIAPFYKNEDGAIKFRELKLHELPWPKDTLANLQGTEVSLRVTLSYFVEPNPGERGWSNKYGYQSHGLRVAVKRARETALAFQKRINKAIREEDYDLVIWTKPVHGSSREINQCFHWGRFIQTRGPVRLRT